MDVNSTVEEIAASKESVEKESANALSFSVADEVETEPLTSKQEVAATSTISASSDIDSSEQSQPRVISGGSLDAATAVDGFAESESVDSVGTVDSTESVGTTSPGVDFATESEIQSTEEDALSSSAKIAAGSGIASMVFATANESSEAAEADEFKLTGESEKTEAEGSSLQAQADGKEDNLTQLEGIDQEAQQTLFKAGCYRFTDIENATTEDLEKVFAKGDHRFTESDYKGWSSQAALQRSGPEETQKEFGFDKSKKDISNFEDDWADKSAAISANISATSDQGDDGLMKIQGIGQATASLLHKSGITTYASLRDAGDDRLQAILVEGGVKFQPVDTSNWTEQARLAASGDWTKLSAWQSANCASGTVVSGSEKSRKSIEVAESEVAGKDLVESEASESEVAKNGRFFVASQSPVSSVASSDDASITTDDLTKIEGIGAATASLLAKSGIKTYRDLQDADSGQLQSILHRGGLKFKMVDSSTWAKQARFAASGYWTSLAEWKSENRANQNSSGRTEITCRTQSMSSKDSTVIMQESSKLQHASKSSKKPTLVDDLTRINGLGPASRKVLNKNGIYSFFQVASMTSPQLEKLFAAMPKRFQLIDTLTWPAQAQKLASPRATRQTASHNLEMEVLDKIDEIQEIASSGKTSSTTHRQVKSASKQD